MQNVVEMTRWLCGWNVNKYMPRLTKCVFYSIFTSLYFAGRCVMNALNGNGETALMRAAFYDYSEAARTILKDGE